MSLRRRASVLAGRVARVAARLQGGEGSALPGLVVEKLDKRFVGEVLGGLKYGVVVVSGTNGKTTTTKIVSELLRSQGLKVFTNPTGSNFVRGVISELLAVVDAAGRLDADIAVLELDEAHAVKFVEKCQPRYTLLLNVMADQTDRFSTSEVAEKLAKVAAATTGAVVINREDSLLRHIKTKAEIVYYGLGSGLRGEFGLPALERGEKLPVASLVLSAIRGQRVSFALRRKVYSTTMEIEGAYNGFNAAGALALIHTILPEVSLGEFLTPLSEVNAAEGRGETLIVAGHETKLILVKNPSGFNLALKSFNSRQYQVAVAVNNAPADGQDIGWVQEVDFTGLDRVELVGGAGAEAVARRLAACGVEVGRVEKNFAKFLGGIQRWDSPGYIFANYTAMVDIRKKLAK